MLFDRQYKFFGTHADEVRRLTAEFDKNKHKLFGTVHEVFQLAPIIGFLYQKKSELNRDVPGDISIFDAEMRHHEDVFEFNYQLIMLLDSENESNFDIRVDKAFKDYGTEKAKSDEDLYESYVRGGIDVLYEKLIESSTTPDDYTKHLYEFIEDFEYRYGQKADEVLDLLSYSKELDAET